MGALDDLKSAGFSDAEIGSFAADKRQTLASAGFGESEINSYLGTQAQPDMAAANKTFARTVGDALGKAATALKPAGDTVMDMASLYAPVEAALNAGTGLLFGFPAYVGGGLGGLISKHLLGMDADPKELAETMSRIATYQPMTERGRRLSGNVMLPLTKLQEGSDYAGERVTDVAMKAGLPDTVSAASGAITAATIQMLAPALVGELARKMGGQVITHDDMTNTARVIAGDGAAPAEVQAVETSLRATYDKTGIGPYTVMEQASKDASIKADLLDANTEVPKAFDGYQVKAEPEAPLPGDGAPLLDVSGATKQEKQNLAKGVEPGRNAVNEPAIVEDAALSHEQDGNPYGSDIVELNSGVNPGTAVKEFVNGYTPYVGVDQTHPVAVVRPAVSEMAGYKPTPLGDALRKIFAPAARGPIAEQQAGIMRANFGEMAREREVALEDMKGIAAGFDKMPVADNIAFIDAMERAKPLTDPKLADAAQQLRGLLDEKRAEVQALGKGQLENFDENYFPHIWKQTDEAMALFSRRPLEGSKGFLKQRTIPYTTDGLRWRAYDADGDFIKSFDTEAQAKTAVPADGRVGEPLTPITTNPVELALLKTREMDKYVYGQRIFEEMKGADLARFVRFGERALPGWTKINDKIARVWSPADVNIHEAYDRNMMGQLQAFAEQIGVNVSRSVKVGGGTGMSEAKTWGWASPSGHVATKFGGPESVLTHELGHELDFKYGLEDQFVNDKATKGELRSLADLRYEGMEVTDSFKKYVRKGTEKIANMVHAYVHMPDRFQEVAPSTYAKFESFLDEHPELSALKDIKPSLVLGSNDATVNAGGMILRGEYYAPDEAATLINNHLSPGLQGNGFYDAWRGVGMAMNSAQLGLSLFHVGFTTMDSMISKVALGVKQLSRGDVGEGLGNVAQGLNPAQPFVNIYKGDKLLRAYLGKLDSPEMAPIVDAIEQAGGRVKMDDFYRNTTVNAFKQALRGGDAVGATKAFLPTVLDRISAPIFEELVPRQKLGVFFDMAKDWLEKNPDADVAGKRAGLGALWDSVDNRMGQLVYDNVFWNRAIKDGLMATVRSVGWNLGTVRELGGGLLDIKDIARDKGISDRTAYVVALPLVAGIYGALMGYAYTGQAPETLKDFFYPKTGRIRPDGSEDRVSLPTYMKDVFAYGEDAANFAEYGSDPTQTLKNKAHPLISTVSQMLNNEDYFGAAIRNPSAPAVQQLMDEADYLIKQITPFSIRNYQQQAKARGEEPSVLGYLTSPSMVGVAPAPGYVTKTAEEQASSQVSRLRDPLMKKFRQEIKEGGDLDKIVPRMVAAGLSKRDIKFVVSSSGDTARPHRLRHFGSTDDEEPQ